MLTSYATFFTKSKKIPLKYILLKKIKNLNSYLF